MFEDRQDAGRRLAVKLGRYAGRSNAIVLALPRGGVPVGFEVARKLHLPLDVFLVRKLGVPGQEELAMGAIASGGVRIVNDTVVREMGVPPSAIDKAAVREERELIRREKDYRNHRPTPDLRGKAVILIDDGLATGSSMRAAVAAVHKLGPERVVVAVPVAAPPVCAEFEKLVDEVECLQKPLPFYAVGAWYHNFSQTTDEEVRDLLEKAAAWGPDHPDH